MDMFGLVVGLLVLVWFFGFHTSARKLADMANEEIELAAVKQKGRHVSVLAGVSLTKEDYEKAKATKEMLNSFKL